MTRQRIVLGAAGVALGLFGVLRLLTQIKLADLEQLAVWLVGAVVIHDFILSPVVAGLGWLIARVVPPRARRFLQPTLVVAALITVIALPMIYRQGKLPEQKGILRQNYSQNLAVALAIVVVIMLAGYVAQLVRDRGTPVADARPRPGPGAGPLGPAGSAGEGDERPTA